MFFTYIWRELRRRHRQALLTALGLAVGVGLVVAVTAYAGGVGKAQDQVLHSLYGVGTDVSVTQTAKLGEGGPMQFGMNPGSRDQQGERFSRDQLHGSPGQQSMAATNVTEIADLDGVSKPPAHSSSPRPISKVSLPRRSRRGRAGRGRFLGADA